VAKTQGFRRLIHVETSRQRGRKSVDISFIRALWFVGFADLNLSWSASTCTSRRPAVPGSIGGGRFFRDLTEDVVREGSLGSVRELVRAMETYLAERNLASKGYVCKKQGKEILAEIVKVRAAQAAPP
jgi:hypothetical protein